MVRLGVAVTAALRAVSRIANGTNNANRNGLCQLQKCTISASMNIVQCRMARAGIGWSLDDLADQSGVARRTIARFEGGESVKLETVEALRAALVKGGALLVEVEGRPGVTVRL